MIHYSSLIVLLEVTTNHIKMLRKQLKPMKKNIAYLLN